eukprot:2329028-Rhodomonas_salina.2
MKAMLPYMEAKLTSWGAGGRGDCGQSEADGVASRPMLRSSALATRCPVLTSAMLLPGGRGRIWRPRVGSSGPH